MHYRSIFISDVHLGTRGSQAEALCDFLRNNTCDTLYLVGDIIDGWRLERRWYFPQAHADVIRLLLKTSKTGTQVYYILGNHDEAFRKFLSFDIEIGNIKMVNRVEHQTVDGRNFLVIHGDFFDQLMLDKKWLMHIGDALYVFMIWFNTQFNVVRGWFGMEYWSLSKWLKDNTKQALNYIHKYEDHVAEYCQDKGYDGVICGHIHHAEIKTIDSIEYMNDGDWVESGSALLEHTDGTFELYFHDQKNTHRNGQSSGSN